MGGISEKTEQVGLPEAKILLCEYPGKTGADECANRDKDQGVGKLPVDFEKKKRIRWRLKKDINIGKHATKTTKDCRRLDRVPIAEGF